MPVVKGDRVAESSKLNRRSVEAQDFYSNLTSRVPDDFGRFRFTALHVIDRMYPRREPTASLIRRTQRLLDELRTSRPDEDGNPDHGLFRTWIVDRVTFAELSSFHPHGNLYHRTPEPPWSEHVHTGRCARTARARAREWGHDTQASALTSVINNMGATEAEGDSNGTRTDRELSSLPSPSSPSSPRIETLVVVQGTGGQAGTADDDGRPRPCPGCGARTLRLGKERDHWFCGRGGCGARWTLEQAAMALDGRIDVLVTLATELGMTVPKEQRRAWVEALMAGSTVEGLSAAIHTAAARAREVAGQGSVLLQQELDRLDDGQRWVEERGGRDVLADQLSEHVTRTAPGFAPTGRDIVRDESIRRRLQRLAAGWGAAQDPPAPEAAVGTVLQTLVNRAFKGKAAEGSPTAPPEPESADDFEIGPDPAA